MGRIRYGFSKLHYAVATEGAGGALTYGTPVAIPGAKSMAMAQAGTQFNEPADNTNWYSQTTNDGYTGTIEFEDTAAADAFLEDVLGYTRTRQAESLSRRQAISRRSSRSWRSSNWRAEQKSASAFASSVVQQAVLTSTPRQKKQAV